MNQGCAGSCNQGRTACNCPIGYYTADVPNADVDCRWDGTSRPAPLDEVLPGHEADDKVPGGGIVRAVGIVALLAVLANVTWQWVRA